MRSVNFDREGKFLVSSSDDKTVKVWNAFDRKVRCTLEGHEGPVRTSGLHPSDTLIVSGSDDCSMRIWDIPHKHQLFGFADHTAPITSTIFHPNFRTVASASLDRKIKFYDIRSKDLVYQFDAHSEGINQISFHPEGNYLISASNDSKLKVWDLRNWKLEFTLLAHNSPCRTVLFSPEGGYFASGGDDCAVMVWKSNFGPLTRETVEELVAPARSSSKPKLELKRSASAARTHKPLLITTNKERQSFRSSFRVSHKERDSFAVKHLVEEYKNNAERKYISDKELRKSRDTTEMSSRSLPRGQVNSEYRSFCNKSVM